MTDQQDDDSRGNGRATFITRDALAARQWEIELAAKQLRGRAAAWLTPPIVTYRNWLEQWWSSGPVAQPPPLTPVQAMALWRRIVADSPYSRLLITPDGAAGWAAEAWALLQQWRVDPAELRADAHQPDFRAFLTWCRTYSAELARHGWIDFAALEQLLVTAPLPSSDLVLTDLDEPTPAARALFARYEEAGRRVERRVASPIAGTQRCVQLAAAADELDAALRWLQRALAVAGPGARVAVVVSGLGERRLEIERALAAAFPANASTPIWHAGDRPAARPSIGAALLGLELCTSRATFATFSRWLRSTFYVDGNPLEHASRALIESRLRDDLRSQLSFAEAYDRCGLAGWLERTAPRVAAVLTATFAAARAVQTATPSRWTQIWQRMLTLLEWTGATASPDDASVKGWHAALDDFARLTPIVGELTAEEALAELERVLDRPTAAPLPATGVHLLERIDDVGPGYAAVWVTGFTDAAWPEPARGNPLLPRALQRAHGMPYSSPRDARDRCERRLARLVARVPTLVVSWPGRVFDYETEPSPAIAGWPVLDAHEIDAATPRALSRRGRETIADGAPPLVGYDLPGGAGMMSKQAKCPIVAFCDYRLGAKALTPLQLGLSSRQRGKAVHAAVEHLLHDQPTQAELPARRATIGSAVETALAALFGSARRPLTPLFELERDSFAGGLDALLAEDSLRAEFRVIAVEQRQVVRIGRFALTVRLDRLDRLADGTLAIIDYKTGKNANPAQWLGERINDAQVPIYTIAAEEPVSCAVIARLHDATAQYLGFWPEDTFPGRLRKLPFERTLAQQIAEWRRQLEQLATEFAAGDTRIFIDTADDARTDFAPLTRIAEQLALRDGSLPPW